MVARKASKGGLPSTQVRIYLKTLKPSLLSLILLMAPLVEVPFSSAGSLMQEIPCFVLAPFLQGFPFLRLLPVEISFSSVCSIKQMFHSVLLASLHGSPLTFCRHSNVEAPFPFTGSLTWKFPKSCSLNRGSSLTPRILSGSKALPMPFSVWKNGPSRDIQRRIAKEG